ncbi:hypothetical protein [Roseateles sp.]|jgi:hypothetical protein|uniref:hypothetical protein n=1 Tax=Roseateles sp. TaxID=1971397 RepID=UPI003BAB3E95
MFSLKTPFALVLALALEAAYGGPMPALKTITLERDCNGCLSGSRLAFHADGSAQVATVGKARLGTADSLCEGRVSIETFEELARLATTGGFLQLDAEIADPQVQDGPWLTLRAEYADGSAKQVFSRGEMAPASLTELVQAIDAAARRIAVDTPQAKGEDCGFRATPR